MIKLNHIHTLVLQNSIAICIYIYGVYHEVDFGSQVKEMIITPTLHRNYHMQQKNMIILKQPSSSIAVPSGSPKHLLSTFPVVVDTCHPENRVYPHANDLSH